ncbi:DUF983 domain-containing protein [Hoeflea prorocentri]|uniref:DUF983 domain-containing protein n=1 Tax=Hoeflea prorocentri TaxID=1922333 RepID=A0A9X3ZHS3_9HYPH|nr:DUF983 domain-containing protein [Hoeflea prorocentri]MCY6381659.1 DUF983 domain-containing protein [Hoeflea prorocentri]MDA5399459.1 DUF983 domain-containing protein [Hoeflea prorocentri]
MSDKDEAHYPPVDPYASGFNGRCPRCGEGRLFSGYLQLAQSCSVCGLDYDFADAGDGPAVFVILLIGFLVVGLALWLEVSYGPPLWLHLLVWIPLSLALCLWLLRALKGVLINLQFKHNAHEGELDNG